MFAFPNCDLYFLFSLQTIKFEHTFKGSLLNAHSRQDLVLVSIMEAPILIMLSMLSYFARRTRVASREWGVGWVVGWVGMGERKRSSRLMLTMKWKAYGDLVSSMRVVYSKNKMKEVALARLGCVQQLKLFDRASFVFRCSFFFRRLCRRSLFTVLTSNSALHWD
jgi:hypothetical protein